MYVLVRLLTLCFWRVICREVSALFRSFGANCLVLEILRRTKGRALPARLHASVTKCMQARAYDSEKQ